MACQERNPLYDIQLERRGPVTIWWFPRTFSQSRYGDRAIGSNACTLIATLIAQRCHYGEITIRSLDRPLCNEALLRIIGEAILEGNFIHEKMLRSGQLQHVNMTVPEAIQAGGNKLALLKEWKSLVYLMNLKNSLYNELSEILDMWDSEPPPRSGSNLFVIVIAENRSVLWVFQKSTSKVTVVDTHQHLSHGMVLAQSPRRELNQLCTWFSIMLKDCYSLNPECYELSFLYFQLHHSGEG